MKIRSVMMALLVAIFFWQPFASAQTAAPIKALILYDAPPGDTFQNMGKGYAIMLRNLIGHFESTVDIVPVQNYTAGKMANYSAIFYIGSYYDNTHPVAFTADVANNLAAGTAGKTLVWFKYNYWKLSAPPPGITFNGLEGLNTAPTSTDPAPGFYDTVNYKNKAMVKYYAYTGGAVLADPDIGVTTVTAPAETRVTITNPKAVAPKRPTVPYVAKSGNFWYFADVPFSYIGPRDRYLVIADMLHDILGVDHAENHRGLVRFEDVGALVTVASMKTLTDYMYSKRIPFAIAAIPHYMDPLGAYNGGVPQEVPLSQASNLLRALNYAKARGGQILMHGYTHQYGRMKNPHTGVSGDDFEFWDIVNNGVVPEEVPPAGSSPSTAWATDRLNKGRAEMNASGYFPFAWEAPHYQSSPTSIQASQSVFKNEKSYQRVVYYTSDDSRVPDLVGNGRPRDFAMGQFFPYFIKRDYYNQKIIPENLGNIEYNICNIDPSSCAAYTWQDLYLNAQYALTVRDGFGSFFFHPFWLEPTLGTPGFADFKRLMDGMTTLGYKWSSPAGVVD